MGNVTTPQQHLPHEHDLEQGISARVISNNNNISTGEERPNIEIEVIASITESENEEHFVDGGNNISINSDNNNNIGNGNESNAHNQHDNNPNGSSGDSRNDPRIITSNNARLHDPKLTGYVLRFYLPLWGIACVKLTGGNYSMLFAKIANPFMIFSLVAFCMALLIFTLLSWIFEHSAGSYSCYKIFKDVYYVFCNLAFVSLMPAVFFTTN